MSAGVLASLPAAAAGAILSSIGRVALWLFGKAVEAPLAALIVAVMIGGSALAMTNALFLQTMRHPAPLFADRQLLTSSISREQVQTTQPLSAKASASSAKPRSEPAPIPAVPDALAKISRDEVKAIQDKLVGLGFFKGEADGYYGPQTATAIRAFEKSIGRAPSGALTPEIMESIMKATLPEPRKKAESTISAKPIAEKLQSREADPLAKIVQKVALATGNAPVLEKLSTTDKSLVSKIQRGLSSLGFLQGKIDGVAGEMTAKAIRNFEVYYNYDVTGSVTPELLDLLVAAGAKV